MLAARSPLAGPLHPHLEEGHPPWVRAQPEQLFVLPPAPPLELPLVGDQWLALQLAHAPGPRCPLLLDAEALDVPVAPDFRATLERFATPERVWQPGPFRAVRRPPVTVRQRVSRAPPPRLARPFARARQPL